LESGALSVRATGLCMLFRLLMACMFPACVAVFFQFKPVGSLLFVLRCGVIPALARRARKRHDLSHR